MIDSHCHLTDPRLRSQLPEVLARAKAAGVERIVTIGTDLDDARDAITLCRQFLNVRCVIGVHPNNVTGWARSQSHTMSMTQLHQLQTDPSVLAIGEIGLDYHYPLADADRLFQESWFKWQLKLAFEVGKPIVIHCREAVDDALGILSEFPMVPAVFHCFTGTPAEAEAILAAGYLLGFTGPITYRNAGHLVDVLRLTPLDRLLVETDGPYLSPEPVRKIKTCEPAFVAHTLAKVAAIKGISVEEADRITTANTLRFYRWE